MQRENWIAVAQAINCYDDAVLIAAREMVLHLMSDNSYDYDTTVLSDALADDEEQIGSDWQEPCWANSEFASAVEQYKNEQHWDAARALATAMLTRSYSWEQAFT